MGSWSLRRHISGRPSSARAALTTVAAGYISVALLLTIRTWAHPSATWPGYEGDPQKFMSFLAWFPFALTHGHNPLRISYIDLPTGMNAMWDTTMPLAAYLVWPVRALFGVIAAYNVLLVIALMLDGLATFVWLRRHTQHQSAAFLGGLMMVVGPYTVARTYGHLNLVLFFALPIMVLLLEDIVREPSVHSLRRGSALGLLAAVQVLCTEEPLALVAVAFIVGLIVAAVLAPRAALRRVIHLVPAGAATVAAFVLIAGVPLAYQFFGPGAIHGALQPHDLFVNDVMNLVVPTSSQVLSPGTLTKTGVPAVPWSGGPIEWNGYIGVPLLLVAGFTLVRWHRNRWLLIVGLTTIALVVLSLGPHPHVNGVDHTRWALPEYVLDKLPVFDNILPDRFSLVADMGIAALLATFIDRVALGSRTMHRVLGTAGVALVAASLWPAALPVASAVIPRYFEQGGDVGGLPAGTPALVFPIPQVGPGSYSTSLWQVAPDFRFKMFSGASISAMADGSATSGSPDTALRCVTDALQLTGSVSCRTTPQAFLKGLTDLRIHLVIVGPTSHMTEITAYLNALTGQPPQADQGVLIWHL